MYCRHCGKTIEGNMKFCPYCGADLTNIYMSNETLQKNEY